MSLSSLGEEWSEGGWTLKHRPDPRFSIHKHGPSQHPFTHPIHRQLSGVTSQFEDLSNVELSPKEIQALVRQKGPLITRQDIYNRIAAVRRSLFEGQSAIHALVRK